MLNTGIKRLLQLTPKILRHAESKANNSTIKQYLKPLEEKPDDPEDRAVSDGEFCDHEFLMLTAGMNTSCKKMWTKE